MQRDIEELSCHRDLTSILLLTSPFQSGQHIFLRFPTLAPLQSHPFTIITLPHPDKNRESQVVCIARVLKGNTQSLHGQIQKQIFSSEGCESRQPSTVSSGLLGKLASPSLSLSTIEAGLIPAIIDGPYGADGAIIASYQSALFVVGGLGLTFALPMMMSLCHQKSCITTTIRLVWSIKTTG